MKDDKDFREWVTKEETVVMLEYIRDNIVSRFKVEQNTGAVAAGYILGKKDLLDYLLRFNKLQRD